MEGSGDYDDLSVRRKRENLSKRGIVYSQRKIPFPRGVWRVFVMPVPGTVSWELRSPEHMGSGACSRAGEALGPGWAELLLPAAPWGASGLTQSSLLVPLYRYDYI